MGSSSGAQGKTKGSSTQVYRSIKIKGVMYNVWLRFKTGDFSVHLENDETGEHWFNAFTPEYIDEMTRKTGNQRRYDVFTSMLASALEKTSSRRPNSQTPLDLSLDLLFVEDLERMRDANGGVHSDSVDATIQSAANKSRCFLIVAYAVEFERTFYPLPLNKSGPPSTNLEEWLLFAYRNTKEQARRMMDENSLNEGIVSTSGVDTQKLRAELKRQKEIILSLEKERNKALEVSKKLLTENNILKEQLTHIKDSIVSRTVSNGRSLSRDLSGRTLKSESANTRSGRLHVEQSHKSRSQRYYREGETSRPPSQTHSRASSRSMSNTAKRSTSRHVSEQPSPAVAPGYLNLSHARSRSASIGNSQTLRGSYTSSMSASLNPFKRTTSTIYSNSASEFDEGLSQQLVEKARRSSSRNSEGHRRKRSSSSHRNRDSVVLDDYNDRGSGHHGSSSSRTRTQRSAQYEEPQGDRHRSGSGRRKHRKEHSSTSRSEKYY
ncbi:Hypothetical protein GLP15_909 [Giardia lamblia P15]|uniref:Uncharacterized protein n=1 Tax=Giardia intestinalis (strain P15) TaxID=658858 RepID=E1EZG7_GIAIA|nr:Hypothetical protein GLP15_909 [Giardia lamblia P15]